MKVRMKGKGSRTTQMYCGECMDEPLQFNEKGQAELSKAAFDKITAHHPDTALVAVSSGARKSKEE